MLIVLTLLYTGLVFLLIKIGVLKPTAFWKMSPLIVLVILFLVLFLPMQWGAPTGPCEILQQVIGIVPNVNGEVSEVAVVPWQFVDAGDVLFKIDPAPFQAAVDSLEAQLSLAETRLDQSKRLLARSAGSEYEVQQFQSQVDALKGQLVSAQWNLDSTVVVAPEEGYLMGVTVRVGQRVASNPAQGYMTLVTETGELLVAINQNVLRHVREGQLAEVVLRGLPGRVLPARVKAIAAMNPSGRLATGSVLTAPQAGSEPFAVMLEIDLEAAGLTQVEGYGPLPEEFGGGLAGTAAIYTSELEGTHGIRKIVLRMEAWRNYVISG